MTAHGRRRLRRLAATLLVLAGCARPPEGRSPVDVVRIQGTTGIDPDELLDRIATAPSEKFLGLFRGVVYEYEIYDVAVLQRDLARIERYCRGHGFFAAHARAARVERTSDGHVRIEIFVDEGPATLNREVVVDGLADLPSPIAKAVVRAAKRGLQVGRRFDEDKYAETAGALKRELTDAGYAYADVVSNARLDAGAHTIDYSFTVRAGPPAIFGPITFEGLDPDGPRPRRQELDEQRLRHALQIAPGDAYSTAALDAATQALLDLGVFSAVEILPDLTASRPSSPSPSPSTAPSASSGPAAAASGPASSASASGPAAAASAPPASSGPAASPDPAASSGPPASSSDPSDPSGVPSSPPPRAMVALTVRVEPMRLRQIRLGGGVDFDQVKTVVHLLGGWEDHNFLGGMRDLRIDFRPGAVLWPTRVNNIVAPDQLLPEERLRIQLRQPGFLEARTNGFLRPELNIYPMLVASTPSPDASIVGYREIKMAAGLDRRFSRFFGSISYNLQVEWPFAYKGPLDQDLGTVVLLFPQLITTLDFRDNPVHPHSGVYFSNDLQLGGVPFRGSAKDIRVQPEVRGYVPLGRRLTWASRGSLGFLFASDYGDTIENPSTITAAGRSQQVRDIETVYLRGFFSGGANSNRGYPFRGIAPHGVVPFLNPSTASQQLALECDPTQGPIDPAKCAIPIGGFTLWELSTELRFNIAGPFASSVFCDASDVSPRMGNLRLDHWHLSCGLGLRYDTPVGPLRFDAGYRIQPLQVLGYRNEDAIAASPHEQAEGIQPRLFGIPLAIAFGIGEAY